MNSKPDEPEFGIGPNSDFPVSFDQASVIERFRAAIRLAGGNQAVASRAGIPKGTINNLLRGTDVRISAAYAIAAACGVSLDWISTGRGDMFTSQHRQALSIPVTRISKDGKTLETTPEYRQLLLPPPQSVAEPAAAPPSPRPSIDVDKLQQAINILRAVDGLEAFAAEGAAARIATAYDVLIGVKP